MVKFHWGMRVCGIFLLWAVTAIALPAQTFTTLLSFDNADGALPTAALVQATDGDLYGTTRSGGANSDACGSVEGCGTVFKMTRLGTLTTLYNFCSQTNCTDGSFPFAGLVQGTDGNFYGTTDSGGANKNCGGYIGCGTVFKMTPSGTLTTIYSFCSQSNCPDGSAPVAGLVQGTDGDFYGTTIITVINGGTHINGTVFKITPSGTLTTLYKFCRHFRCTDGSYPDGALVQATDGDFYGTTAFGGAGTACRGCGTVFKITPSGTLTTLHSFDKRDGSDPFGGLVQATDGNFYGTTDGGGTDDYGTVFKISPIPPYTLTVLHSFDRTDGQVPAASLVQGTDGNFYGTTSDGGANNNCGADGCGTIFGITSNGTLTTLYNFCSQGGSSCTDGYAPQAALVQDTNGKFYGTTSGGGANSSCDTGAGCGTVFNLSVGLVPFVETQPASGKVGAVVNILGTNLNGATSVTFNGTSAAFTVKSQSEITTTVPVGATTGTIQVVTPISTFLSNVAFTVKP